MFGVDDTLIAVGVWMIYEKIKDIINDGSKSPDPAPKPEPPHISKKIFVFGNRQSGKTTLLKALGASLPEGATSIISEKYDSFSVRTKNGTNLTVLAGTDVNGDKRNIDDGKLLKLLEDNDRFIYTFDESVFLDPEKHEYKNMVLAHIHHIYDYATKTNTLDRVKVIGTHVDKCANNREMTKEQISNIFATKCYFEKFKTQFFQHNLTEENEQQDLINEIFE